MTSTIVADQSAPIKVGYIGLGTMGRALARHLPKVSELFVFDLNPAAIDELTTHGARPASSIAELGAASSVVFLCLPRSSDVETVLFGPDGLATTLAPGSIIIDQTSGVPSETRRFAVRLAEQGVAMLDAPVAGGVPGAIAGTITMMVSGEDAAYDRALPLLHGISPNVFRCSARVGDGQALKSINNIINNAYRTATLEAVALGHAIGLSIATMAKQLDAGPGSNFATGRLLTAIAENRSSTQFALKLSIKDFNQAIKLGEECQAPMPLADLTRAMFQTALNMLGPDAQLDEFVPFMERVTGQTFGEAPATNQDFAEADAIALLGAVLSGVNHLVLLESAAISVRCGLDLVAIEPILASGSASSKALASAFATTRGEANVKVPSLGETLAALDRAATLAADHGVTMTITNTVRALYQAVANVAGADAGLSAMLPPR